MPYNLQAPPGAGPGAGSGPAGVPTPSNWAARSRGWEGWPGLSQGGGNILDQDEVARLGQAQGRRRGRGGGGEGRLGRVGLEWEPGLRGPAWRPAAPRPSLTCSARSVGAGFSAQSGPRRRPH